MKAANVSSKPGALPPGFASETLRSSSPRPRLLPESISHASCPSIRSASRTHVSPAYAESFTWSTSNMVPLVLGP
eukprot:2765818-Prymnesium_polylepis.1